MRAAPVRACLFCLATSAIVAPSQVRAEGYVTPWVGANLQSATDNGRSALGVTTGYMGAGIFGFEADVGYFPDFFRSSRLLGNSSAITVMGDFILGVPIGGTHGAGIRPFISGGLGFMRTRLETSALPDASQSITEPTYDLGAGLMGFFSSHVGLRGDVRYLHAAMPGRLSGVNADLVDLHSVRISMGVTFR